MKANIVVSKNLNPGQKANVAAIIMGQFGRDISGLYSDAISDSNGVMHAGISVNVVVLEGGEKQLSNLANNAKSEDVVCVAFSGTGQSLSNSYDEYKTVIQQSGTEETHIVGVGVYGSDDSVKALTKKFSLMK